MLPNSIEPYRGDEKMTTEAAATPAAPSIVSRILGGGHGHGAKSKGQRQLNLGSLRSQQQGKQEIVVDSHWQPTEEDAEIDYSREMELERTQPAGEWAPFSKLCVFFVYVGLYLIAYYVSNRCRTCSGDPN